MQSALHIRIINNFRIYINDIEILYEAENSFEIPFLLTIKYEESLGDDNF